MGLRTVAVYSTPDAGAPHVREADLAGAAGRRHGGRVLPGRREDHGRGAAHRGRGGPSGLRVPGRERRLRAGLRGLRPGVRRAGAGGDPADGLKPEAKAAARAAGLPVLPDALLGDDRTATPRRTGCSPPSRSASRSWSRRRPAAAGWECASWARGGAGRGGTRGPPGGVGRLRRRPRSSPNADAAAGRHGTASASPSAPSTRRIPLPPPPAAALTSSGKPTGLPRRPVLLRCRRPRGVRRAAPAPGRAGHFLGLGPSGPSADRLRGGPDEDEPGVGRRPAANSAFSARNP